MFQQSSLGDVKEAWFLRMTIIPIVIQTTDKGTNAKTDLRV